VLLKLQNTQKRYRLTNDKVYKAPKGWKLSALAELQHPVKATVACIYDNKSRRDSKIIVDGKEIAHFNAETIGQPLVWGNYVAMAGECFRLIYYHEGNLATHFPLKWASACTVWNGNPVVINWDGKRNSVLECVMGNKIAELDAGGIALSAIDYKGVLVAATTDDDKGRHGVIASNGEFIRLDSCQCVARFFDKIIFTSKNKVYVHDGNNYHQAAEMPCEKIMDLHVFGEGVGQTLRIACANPDSVWDADYLGNMHFVGEIKHGNTKIGGTCFNVRATQNYFARCADGDTAEIYKIDEVTYD